MLEYLAAKYETPDHWFPKDLVSQTNPGPPVAPGPVCGDLWLCFQPVAAGLDVFESRPKLSAWRERVVEAVGRELYDEAHKTVLGAQEFVKTLDSSKMEPFRPRVLRLIS